jgi:peptidoglycan/xylan/chitin deacetylase (PgdA/CDA1 family)
VLGQIQRPPVSAWRSAAILVAAAAISACGPTQVTAGAGLTALSHTVRPAGRLSPGTTAISVAVDRATGGYWILKSNGGVANFHAPWNGSLLGKVPAGSVATAIATGRPGGYLVLTSDGGVYGFGTRSYGSDAGKLPPGVIAVGLTSDPRTGGYWILRSDGVVDSFHAPHRGSVAGPDPAGSAVLAIGAGKPGGYLVMTAKGALPVGYGGHIWKHIPTKQKVAALTFDIGAPNLGGLPKVLATLRRDHAASTFFLIGAWVSRFKAAAREIVKSGAAIGDLSLDHEHFPRISDYSMREQVLGAQSEIEKITGAQPWPWFRFPFGDHNNHTIAVVNSLGFATIGWTVDTLGWEGTSRGITVRSIIRRVVSARRPGEIVLMHPAATVDHSILDAQALPGIIKALRHHGYSFVTINALQQAIGFRVPKAVVAIRGFGTRSYGSNARSTPAGSTAIAIAGDPKTGGYWIVDSDGTVAAFHAPLHGSLAGHVPHGYSITAIAAGLNGGYVVLTSNGGIHSFGTPWYGSIISPWSG